MFEYFPNNYTWSLAVMGAINRGGKVSEIDEACGPLKEFAGVVHCDGLDVTKELIYPSVADAFRRRGISAASR